MKHFFCIFAVLFIFVQGFAQPKGREERMQSMQRVHAIKVAYITDRLHLTAEQSQQFWPVYNAYEKEHIALRKDFFQKYKGTKNSDDDLARQRFNDDLDFQAATVDLKRKYRDQFLKILSPVQLANLFKSEHEFNTLLLQRMKDKHNSGDIWSDK